MRLEGLERLAISMRAQHLECQLFEHRHGRAAFDVFFHLGRPSEMLIGARGARTPLAIRVEVQDDGSLNPFLGDDYGALCDFLGIRPNPENPFSPRAFFQELEMSVPLVAQHARVPAPYIVARYREVEEADKLYFMGWRHNTPRGTRVTEPNLEKTRVLLGWQAFDLCRRANVSSCWTDDPRRAIGVELQGLHH